mmetsp:Transcript_277/g.690  ORF Transcript_277/g.690 Transcript_277/m.690 type:complete len:86 (+) Transcript_277:1831-2088(+)
MASCVYRKSFRIQGPKRSITVALTIWITCCRKRRHHAVGWHKQRGRMNDDRDRATVDQTCSTNHSRQENCRNTSEESYSTLASKF